MQDPYKHSFGEIGVSRDVFDWIAVYSLQSIQVFILLQVIIKRHSLLKTSFLPFTRESSGPLTRSQYHSSACLSCCFLKSC